MSNKQILASKGVNLLEGYALQMTISPPARAVVAGVIGGRRWCQGH